MDPPLPLFGIQAKPTGLDALDGVYVPEVAGILSP